MDKQLCAGCRTELHDKKFVNCLGCNQKYDMQCANLSPKRYRNMNEETKRRWRCIECKSSQPKSDNTNTPVRSSGPPRQLPEVEAEVDSPSINNNRNVTLRRGQSPIGTYITEERLKEFLKTDKKELSDVIESCVKKLSAQLDEIKVQCSGYPESLSFICSQYEDLQKEVTGLKKLIGSTTEDNKQLKEQLKAQAARIRVLEDGSLKQQQWSRLQNIEVVGIPESKDEDTLDIVTRVMSRVGVPVAAADVEFAHRVQPRHAASAARARAIVVRLRQRAHKDNIVAAARKHRNLTAKDLGIGTEAQRIYINEHLTRENKMIFSECKQKAKELQFKYVWVKNCRIYVRRNDTSPPILISSKADLSKIA